MTIDAQENIQDDIILDDENLPIENETESLKNEVAALKDQMLRVMADAENTRKRAQKDREDASRFAVTSFARDLLSMVDNFDRALNAITPDQKENAAPEWKNLMEGIESIHRGMQSTLSRHGIEKIDTKDQSFDPNLHEVLFEAPIPNVEKGKIIETIEAGYTINGRLLRAAKVGIAAGGAGTGATPPKAGSQIDQEV